jgi:hypothetical protein
MTQGARRADPAQVPLFYQAAAPAPAVTAGSTLPAPATWADLVDQPERLFAARTTLQLRSEAREAYDMQASGPVVSDGLAWLEHHYHDGRIGAPAATADSDIASQSLALLALLGEGAPVDERRQAVVRGVAATLAGQDLTTVSSTAAGLCSLALVEAAWWCHDPALQRAAEQALAVVPDGAGHGAAWGLLAARTAAVCGYAVTMPPVLAADRDVLSVQVTNGVHASFDELTAVVAGGPARARDGSLDLLAWWAPSLALREFGGRLWQQWAAEVEGQIIARRAIDEAGRSYVPASAVRHAELAGPAGDVFATSLALLNLQVAYRYPALAR